MNRIEIDWFSFDFLYIEFLVLWLFVISWFFFFRSTIFSLVSNSMFWIKNKPKNCFIENEQIKYFIIKLNQTDSLNHNLFCSWVLLPAPAQVPIVFKQKTKLQKIITRGSNCYHFIQFYVLVHFIFTSKIIPYRLFSKGLQNHFCIQV